METNYLETFYEIATYIEEWLTRDYQSRNSVIDERYEAQGSGAKYELAQEWTDEFEREYEGVEWGVELDWMSEIEEFCGRKNLN